MESPRCSAVSCKASLCTLLLSHHSFFKPAGQEIKGYAATIEIQNMEGHSRRNNRSSSLIEEHWLFPATLKTPVKKKKKKKTAFSSTAEAPKAEISDKMYYLNGDTRGIPEDPVILFKGSFTHTTKATGIPLLCHAAIIVVEWSGPIFVTKRQNSRRFCHSVNRP